MGVHVPMVHDRDRTADVPERAFACIGPVPGRMGAAQACAGSWRMAARLRAQCAGSGAKACKHKSTHGTGRGLHSWGMRTVAGQLGRTHCPL